MNHSPSETELLQAGAAELGVTVIPFQAGQLSRYLSELARWNRGMNLIGTRDRRAIVIHHVLDSLAGVLALPEVSPVAVADLGAGAGFPGLPLKIARPGMRLTLIEPRQKRAAFLLHVCGVLELSDVKVAEISVDPRRPSPLVGQFDRVLMRAVADPAVAVNLARPLLRSTGKAILWVSDRQASRAPRGVERLPYRLPGTKVMRALLIADH